MNTGKTLFAQLMDFLPWTTFTRIVERHGGDRYVKSLVCTEQFRAMAFAQLTYRESLRDIEACLSAQAVKLYHTGFKQKIKRSTPADANETRDWHIHAEFAQCLIVQARNLYLGDSFGVDLENTIYALDSTTIAKSNARLRRVYSAPIDRSTGIICDQTVALTGVISRKDYPEHLRRIRFKDPETGKTLVFLTNNFTRPTATICALYKARWQMELFFKWIKQHLRIKKFYGNSENAVKSQIWMAVSVYVLVAIVKKRLDLDASLYTLLQVLSVTLFEKMPLQQAIPGSGHAMLNAMPCNQLNLFAY